MKFWIFLDFKDFFAHHRPELGSDSVVHSHWSITKHVIPGRVNFANHREGKSEAVNRTVL